MKVAAGACMAGIGLAAVLLAHGSCGTQDVSLTGGEEDGGDVRSDGRGPDAVGDDSGARPDSPRGTDGATEAEAGEAREAEIGEWGESRPDTSRWEIEDRWGERPDASDGSADGSPACECVNPSDECWEQTCRRAGYTCNALHACESGYECSYDGHCNCIDAGRCGILCARTGYCPSGSWTLACAADGICRPPLACLSDEMCPPWELCIGSAGIHAVCAPPGTGEVDTPCSANTDCRDGVCTTSVCVPRCRSNADCPAGLTCARTSDNQLGCMLPGRCGGSCSGDLCDPCTEPDDYCSGSDCRRGCLVSGECAEFSDCLLDPRSGGLVGECGSGPHCGLWEFRQEDRDRCLIHVACRGDAECPEGYGCFPYFDDGAGYCGR